MTIHDVAWHLCCGDAPPLPDDVIDADYDAALYLLADFDCEQLTEAEFMASAAVGRIVAALERASR